jgi:RimJ/RimL family protein N-acetyltransferase
MKYLFYCQESSNRSLIKLNLGTQYKFEFWRPTIINIIPPGLSVFPFTIWWFMHYLHIFKNNDYELFLVYDGKTLVHRSGIFPGYFRFPFMAKNDLQIGDIWTHPIHRGRGISSFAIQQIFISRSKPGRKFWYVVENNNLPSIKVIEKIGFRKVGEGIRKKRFGLRFLGSYEMTTVYDK